MNPSRDNLGGFFICHLQGNGGDKEVLFGVTIFLAIVFLWQLGHWADNRKKRIVLSLLAGIGFYVGTKGSLLFYKLALLYDEQSVIIFLVSGFFTIGLSMVFRRVLSRYKYIFLILIVSSFSIILGGFTFSMPAAEMSSWLVSAGYVLFIFFFCTADLSRRLNDSRAVSDEDGIGKWGWGFIVLTKLALLTRSSNLYGMLTTDDPYQYLGGLGLAIRTLDGTTPELWIANLRDPNNARMQTAEKFLTDELRSRYWNELWIEGQINEGLSGASQIARVLENLWGWQVMAPEIVGDFMWDTFKAIYVDDKYNLGINDWFNQHNPYAFQSLVGRMLEAIRKDYWDASEDTIRQLTDAYSRSVNQFGPAGTVHLNSPQFRAFLDSIQSISPPVSAIDNSTQLPVELVQLPQESIEMPAVLPVQPPAMVSTSSVPAEPKKTNERSPEITVSPVTYQPKPVQQKNEEKSIDEPVAQEENAEAVQEKTEEPKTKAYELKIPDAEQEKQKIPAAVLPGIALAVSGMVGVGNILTKRKLKL